MTQAIIPQDDRLHPPKDNPTPIYRESFFWGFHDPNGIWGMGNIAFHHNISQTDRFLVLVLPDGRLLACAQVDDSPIQDTSLITGTIRFINVEPLVGWQMQAEAPFMVIPQRQDITRILGAAHNAGSQTGPSGDLKRIAALFPAMDTPFETVPVRWDLEYTTITGPQGVDWSFFGTPARHYQAAGRVEGTIQVGDRTYPFAGYGPHDHSWGPRDWMRPRVWYFGCFQVGESSIHLVRSQTTDDQRVESGFIYRDGQVETLRAVAMRADHDPQNHHVTSAEIVLTTEGGDRVDIRAQARDHYHFTVHVQNTCRCHGAETLVTVQCFGTQGQGILEYGHQIS